MSGRPPARKIPVGLSTASVWPQPAASAFESAAELGYDGVEVMVPGRGNQPCAQLCEGLASGGFAGQVVLEVNTRKARSTAERTEMLNEALLFARLHLEWR